MSKRQRGAQGQVIARVRRPIDKEIVVVFKTGLVGTQAVTTLKTTTFPCTITGLRWDIEAAQIAGTAVSKIAWAIVLVPEGDAINTLVISDAGSLYSPEQNVMAFGMGLPQTTSNGSRFQGSTKTMRKMRGGDLLQFVAVSEATNSLDVFGAIQFFCKS